jgi:hypothetical protein
LAIAVLKETHEHTEINVLLFHASMNKYIPRRIDGYVEKYFGGNWLEPNAP